MLEQSSFIKFLYDTLTFAEENKIQDLLIINVMNMPDIVRGTGHSLE